MNYLRLVRQEDAAGEVSRQPGPEVDDRDTSRAGHFLQVSHNDILQIQFQYSRLKPPFRIQYKKENKGTVGVGGSLVGVGKRPPSTPNPNPPLDTPHHSSTPTPTPTKLQGR